LSQPTSFFLDLLRLGAALAVFAGHCLLLWYGGQTHGIWDGMGHRAVIVFFVLSGYVIAYSTFRKTRDARAYILARLSRLYSVIVPALALTLALQYAGTAINAAYYQPFNHGYGSLRYLLTGLCLQSLWQTNTSPPTNGPFWSLGYEFWYYALFGAAVLIRPLGWRIFAVLALALIVGPNVLLLLPCWLMGVLLYLYGRRVAIPTGWAIFGICTMLAALVLMILFTSDWPRDVGYKPCFYSNAFGSDSMMALLLAALIWFFDHASHAIRIPDRLDAIVRWTADHTFSLYLYHFPLLLFVAATIPFDRSNPLQVAGVTGGVLAIIVVLSLMTESKRPLWHTFFSRCWDAVASRTGFGPMNASPSRISGSGG
jgi:peptidoglycan/LPS O-acetylase OafA/YrhL